MTTKPIDGSGDHLAAMRAAQEKLRQEAERLARASHQAHPDQPAQDAQKIDVIDKQTFVESRVAAEGEGSRAKWEAEFDQVSGKDHQLNMDEFMQLTSGTAALQGSLALGNGQTITADEARALLFHGRDDLADGATKEFERLKSIKDPIDLDTFVNNAQLAGQTKEQLATDFKLHAQGNPPVLDAHSFDMLYNGVVGVGSSFRTIDRDPNNANSHGAVDEARAREELAANSDAEQATRGSLPLDQQAQYDRVKAAATNDPQAQRALQAMLLDGRLPGNHPDAEGQNLLGALDRMAAAPVQAPIDRAELLSNTIREVENPASINQWYRGTCAATTAEILMAGQDPAEYARLVTGLASPEGEVKTRSGEVFKRQAGTEAKRSLQVTDKDGNPELNPDGSPRSLSDPRTISARLFQPAAMALAKGSTLTYENQTDVTRDANGKVVGTGGGLSGDENARLTNALTGTDVKNDDEFHEGQQRSFYDLEYFSRVGLTATDHERLVRNVEDAVAAGKQVQVGVDWGESDAKGAEHGSHKLLVTGIDANTVTYKNPWGIEEHMSRAEFERRLHNATL